MNDETLEISIVIPTYNEKENIDLIINVIKKTLIQLHWQIIFVDDNSPDGTANHIKNVSIDDPRIDCLVRKGKRDLSSACIDGILASSSPYVAIIDADLQHDETIIPEMLKNMKQNNYDLIIGTRYKNEGGTRELKTYRVLISRFATWLGRLVINNKDISDPMSGFFLIKKDFFEKIHNSLSIKGYKILLDILSSSDKNTKILEIPYTMHRRLKGKSKLGVFIIWQYIYLVIEIILKRIFSTKFLLL